MREKSISIHSPRVRGDLYNQALTAYNQISIHSPRVRGDDTAAGKRAELIHFYPLPSGEGRRVDRIQPDNNGLFLSTPLG